ncbi:MAG: hypothetical protein KME09_01255 [Pleurocapsa minor HA4230-MV1]|jgi:hypothetical protein|nr:hypothetical protein [Pleurocapsa minor HA4230-MV1]
MTEAIERLKDRQKRKVSARNPSLNSQAKNDSIAEDSQLLNQSSNDNCLTANNQVVKQLNSNSSVTENSQSINESEINDSITEDSQSINESEINDSMTESSQGAVSRMHSGACTRRQSVGLEADGRGLGGFPHERPVQETEPMRRTIRLDPAVDKLMDTLCRENRVTRETLIEAAILTCSKNQKTLNKAIVEAKDRYKNRKRIGELKKLQTMNRKFGRDIS